MVFNRSGACKVNIIGKELLTQIEACEAAGDVDGMIGYLLVSLDRARELQRQVNEDIEYHPTTMTGHYIWGNDENTNT